MRRNMIWAALTALFLLMATDAKADVVLFDFENDGAAATPFGQAIDVGPGFTGTQAGITFTATATSNVAGTTVPNGVMASELIRRYLVIQLSDLIQARF